jgi:Uma2 family endonuclease
MPGVGEGMPPLLPVTVQMIDALIEAGLISQSSLLTVEQVDYLYRIGLVPEKSELLNGEIREKLPQDGPHIWGVRHAHRKMVGLFGYDFVFSRSPLLLGEYDAPEPDVFVTVHPDRAYVTAKPPADETVIVIEISDSTLRYDRENKGPRYAAGGIPEYWIVDVNARTLIVYRNPTATGYGSEVTLTESDTVSPLAAPQDAIPVSDLLP